MMHRGCVKCTNSHRPRPRLQLEVVTMQVPVVQVPRTQLSVMGCTTSMELWRAGLHMLVVVRAMTVVVVAAVCHADVGMGDQRYRGCYY